MDIAIIIIVLVLTIIIYVIVSNYFKTKIKSNKYRILVSIIISSFLGIILYVISVTVTIYFLFREKSREFERKNWVLSGEDMEKRLSRYEMIDDLIDERLLDGKDSLQVKEIIGNPDVRNKENNSWEYDSGTGGGLGFVDHYLEVYFKNGKVYKVIHKRIQD
ncbi:hypothetical protein MKS83_11630 [Chryseobacterium sp. Y16C]|uniref:hypothetical protein n=1 Tax=Chryseobacterium sp. Y16C TaxID=2920939 RepID=UPI001F0B0318|nr:hypothetical protein [Chryseobacterium sp. Y16C]UMQ40050.1 hypothetical protein MKS83_11630 [Chryseobacterium sp. Y16C]